MKDPVNRDFDEIGQEALRVLLVVADGEMLLSLTVSFKYLLIGSLLPVELELELLSVEEVLTEAFGPFDSRSVNRLEASVVSLEVRSLSREVRACWSGLAEVDLLEELAALG